MNRVAGRVFRVTHPFVLATSSHLTSPVLGVILSTMKMTCEQQLNTQAVAEATLPEEQRLMIRCGFE